MTGFCHSSDTAIPCKEYELHLAASASSKRAH